MASLSTNASDSARLILGCGCLVGGEGDLVLILGDAGGTDSGGMPCGLSSRLDGASDTGEAALCLWGRGGLTAAALCDWSS